MEEKNIQNEEVVVESVIDAANSVDSQQPILPDEVYAAEVAKEDPEELEKARKKLMNIIRIKGRCIGGDTLANQIQPMVYAMSIRDCENMYSAVSRHGIIGLMHMVSSHNKELKKEQKK